MTEFNREQLLAIHHINGPMMVIAGPGSGKTTVTTNRIRFLTEEAGIPPGQILAITFTKAAAEEMRLRYLRLTGRNSTAVTFGTFHSVFLSVLRCYIRNFRVRLIDSAEAAAVLKTVCSRIIPENRMSSDFYFYLLAEMSKMKNGMKVENSMINRIFPAYSEYMASHGLIDFDDMLLLCGRLLKRDGCLLQVLRNRFRYLIIDEFQDINRIQFEIVYMLAGNEKNLFIVGDDDQSIYGFRGSAPEIMLQFPRIFPGTKVVKLLNNYRSSANIVDRSSMLILHNRNRYRKELRAVKAPGPEIQVEAFDTAEEEARAVINVLMQLPPDKNAAVLYRTHRAGLPVAELIIAAVRKNAACIGRTENLSFMTFHASKGLEFDVVFMIEASDQITPGRKKGSAEIEEERRMFYVAMTRAKEKLHIFYTLCGYNKNCRGSRYLNDFCNSR